MANSWHPNGGIVVPKPKPKPPARQIPGSSFAGIGGWNLQSQPGPATAPSPAPAPPPPPPAPVDSAPWLHDPGYQAAIGAQQATGGVEDAGALYTRNTGLTDLGFTGDVNPNDAFDIQNLRVDPTNPYSKAGLLQRHYDQSRAGDTTSLAARGQLYSGALQNALNNDQENFNQDFTGLTRQAAQLAGNAGLSHAGTAAAGSSATATAIANFLARQTAGS